MKQTYIKVEETHDVVTDGLILYLDAKDTNSYPGTGTVWYDLSGNGHHAYGDPGAGGAGTNSANFPTYQSTDGGRFYFDGTDGLTITTNMGSHTSLTADFWCYRNSAGDTQYFFDARNGGGTYWLSNYQSFNVNIGDIFKVNNPTTYNATSNWWYEWINMTITVNSSGSALYINGELYTTGPTFDSDLGQYFRIGNRSTSSNRWIGYWSNIRFYNRVLSSAEIEQNYKAVNGDTNIIWKKVKNVWVNNLGTWVDKVIPKINVSGTWKDAMEYVVYPTSGLVAYYRLDEGIGTNLSEQVSSYNGTVVSAVWSVAGKNNNCLSFSNEKYATFPHVLNVTAPTSSFSVSLWSYPTSTKDESFMIHKGVYPYNIRIDRPNGKFNFAGAINGVWKTAQTTGTYPINNWYHIVAVYDATTGVGKKLYVNGVLSATERSTGTLLSSTSSGIIGRYSGANGYDFDGKLDEIGFWNRPLTQAEVTTLYNSGSGIYY